MGVGTSSSPQAETRRPAPRNRISSRAHPRLDENLLASDFMSPTSRSACAALVARRASKHIDNRHYIRLYRPHATGYPADYRGARTPRRDALLHGPPAILFGNPIRNRSCLPVVLLRRPRRWKGGPDRSRECPTFWMPPRARGEGCRFRGAALPTRLRRAFPASQADRARPPCQVPGLAHRRGRTAAQSRTRDLAARHLGRSPREMRPQPGGAAAGRAGPHRPPADGPDLRGSRREGHRDSRRRVEGPRQVREAVAGEPPRLRNAAARKDVSEPGPHGGGDGGPGSHNGPRSGRRRGGGGSGSLR